MPPITTEVEVEANNWQLRGNGLFGLTDGQPMAVGDELTDGSWTWGI